MSHWQHLNIAPTSDIREIKKAYAVLLKRHRPDDDPEGFARLHAAYKQALREASYGQRDTSGDVSTNVDAYEPLDRESDAESLNSGLSAEQNPERQPTTEEREDRALQAQWDELSEAVDQVFSRAQSAADPDAWRFLEQSDALVDLRIRVNFSYFLFQRWLDFLTADGVEREAFGAPVAYTAELLNWEDKRAAFEDYFGSEQADLLLGMEGAVPVEKLHWRVSNSHRGPLELASYWARLFATTLDLLLLGVAILALREVDQAFGSILLPDNLVGIAGIYLLAFLVASTAMEASPMQGSVGKVLFGVKVTTRKGRRLGPFHAFFRTLIYVLAMIAIKFTVWINFFLPDARLLHDRLSVSVVVKR